MTEYSEIAARGELSDAIECFWNLRGPGNSILKRVVPDGCADLLFTRGSGAQRLQIVGPMTRFEDVPIEANAELVGVRFRTAMGPVWMRVPAGEIVDEVIDLDCCWGVRARELCDRLADAKTFVSRMAILAASLDRAAERSPIQRALGALERSGGKLSLDQLMQQAGLSARQFRRRCIEESGVSPKLLARILRFRQVWLKARKHAGEHAILAAECGYTDQSHMIAEFRRFSGQTPGFNARIDRRNLRPGLRRHSACGTCRFS